MGEEGRWYSVTIVYGDMWAALLLSEQMGKDQGCVYASRISFGHVGAMRRGMAEQCVGCTYRGQMSAEWGER